MHLLISINYSNAAQVITASSVRCNQV
uniref:Uncharacterized protein n=1 Tax=Anguilla anguilla TaxID=7936 RepID=A0A0E9PSQ4_ANGAN